MTTYRGVSMAPQLSLAKLNHYRALAADAGGELGEALEKLADLAWAYRHFIGPPAPDAPGTPHPAAPAARVVALTEAERAALAPLTPTDCRLQELGILFSALDPEKDKPIRDCAYHLLWLAGELSLGRHPLWAPVPQGTPRRNADGFSQRD